MRDIFLLIKDRHTYYKKQRKIKYYFIFDKRRRRFTRHRLITWKWRKRRRWMSAKRAVYHKKKYIWKGARRPFINKKPYWRWKSYKAVRFASYAVAGFGHAQDDEYRAETIGWKTYDSYYRRKRYLDFYQQDYNNFMLYLTRKRKRMFFKSKLYLNLHFARLFEYPSRKRLYQARKFFKNKHKKLGYFLNYFLNRLDIFVWRWRGEWERWTLRKAQLMVYHGLVLINFKRKKTYLYRIKPADCVIVVMGGQRAFGFYWKFYRSNFLKFGKTKYRPGYPVVYRGVKRWAYKDRKLWSWSTVLMRAICTDHWNRLFFKFYKYFYEASKTIHAYVYILPVSFFNVAKIQLASMTLKKRIYRMINTFVNMSFV